MPGSGGRTDADTFTRVALPFLGSVRRFALSLTRNEADADDLVQETYLQAFRGWHTFEPGTNCRAWLFTICRNTLNRLRSRKQVETESLHGDMDAVTLHGDVDALPSVLGHAAAAQQGITHLLDRIDVRPAIERAVRQLPEPHRSIVVLIDVEGLSYEEAGRVLAVPVGTVRSRLFRARRRIQEALFQHAEDIGLVHAAAPIAVDAPRTQEVP